MHAVFAITQLSTFFHKYTRVFKNSTSTFQIFESDGTPLEAYIKSSIPKLPVVPPADVQREREREVKDSVTLANNNYTPSNYIITRMMRYIPTHGVWLVM